MLNLVTPDRHAVSIVNEKGGRQEDRVGKEPVISGKAFGNFVLVTVATLQSTHRADRGQYPG